MSRLFRAALAALSLAAVLGLPTSAHASIPTKVAIIVGPVGELTPTYLALAERAAATAEQHGATVARAYSPNATPANVLAAVADANIVVYFGHGYGHPSPYGGLDSSRQNGWGLQGPAARGTHDDGLDGYIQYFGEDWIVANARPAPGFVMIYSNTCYAPGASEGGMAPASPTDAALRVAYYSRATFALGGSAYYATDFDAGASDLVGRLLSDRWLTYGAAFASDYRFMPSAMTSQAHPFSPGQAIWLHRSIYAKGPPNYWYAFAGNPDLAPMQAWDRAAPTATLAAPLANATDVPVGAVVQVQMSEPVFGVSASSVTLRDGAGEVVAATVAYDEASSVATLRPAAPLALSTTYSVSVGDGVSDVAGKKIAPVTWRFTTRLDADPLVAPLSIVLEAGAHELIRIPPDGAPAETRTLEVIDQRWLLADSRARLPERPGSWFRIDGPAFNGWWVAESAVAHALGQTEEAVLAPGAKVTLRRSEHPVLGAGSLGTRPGDTAADGDEVVVAVDRRRVTDGRTELRLADTRLVGAWIEVEPARAPTEAVSMRVLETVVRDAEVTLSIEPGDRQAFLFDGAGRVVDRRMAAIAPDAVLTALEMRIVAGSPFFVIARGDLAGWAVPDGAGIRILDSSVVPAARD